MISLLGKQKATQSHIFFKKGDAFRNDRDWLAAAESYKSGLEINSDHFPIWVQLGNVLKEAGDLAAASQAYAHALKLNPRDADLQVQIGHLHARRGDTTQARQHYATAVTFGSKDEHALQVASPSRFISAVVTTEVQSDELRDPPSRSAAEAFQLADSLRDKRRWADAAAAFAEGLAIEPKAFGMWVQMGHMLKEAGRPLEAEAAYTQALHLNSTDADLMLQIGHLSTLLNDPSRACLFYAQSIGLGLRDRHAVMFLARHPGYDRVVREVAARLLPQADRWKAARSQGTPCSFTHFILGIAA